MSWHYLLMFVFIWWETTFLVYLLFEPGGNLPAPSAILMINFNKTYQEYNNQHYVLRSYVYLWRQYDAIMTSEINFKFWAKKVNGCRILKVAGIFRKLTFLNFLQRFLIFPIFPEFGEIFKLLIFLNLRLLEAFWGHLWTLCVFWVFGPEIIDFWLHFFEKVIIFLRGSQAFPVINFRSPFPRRIPLLNFILSDFWEKLNCPYLLINSS